MCTCRPIRQDHGHAARDGQHGAAAHAGHAGGAQGQVRRGVRRAQEAHRRHPAGHAAAAAGDHRARRPWLRPRRCPLRAVTSLRPHPRGPSR